MNGTLARQSIPFFIMRAVERVNPVDYEACEQTDAAGLRLIEAATGKPLTEMQSWQEIVKKVHAQRNDGLTLRCQILYSTYMLAKITRVIAVDDLTAQDSTITGYTYYLEQKEKRTKLLQDWIIKHPEDSFLLGG